MLGKPFSCRDDEIWEQEQVAQEVCGICILKDTQSSLGQGTEQPTLAGCALSKGVSEWPLGIPSRANYPTVLRMQGAVT